jgi:hypothetical protein
MSMNKQAVWIQIFPYLGFLLLSPCLGGLSGLLSSAAGGGGLLSPFGSSEVGGSISEGTTGVSGGIPQPLLISLSGV